MQIICEAVAVSVEDRQIVTIAAWAGRAQAGGSGIWWSANLHCISPEGTLEPCFPKPVI